MKRFLYLTPYFPPQSKVGALRPLKFARHLPRHGWAPVILADLHRGDDVAPGLHDLLPDSCDVIRDYSARAAGAWRSFTEDPQTPAEKGEPSAAARTARRVGHHLASALPLPGPEFLPLGEHSPRMLHALRAGRRLLAEFPCEAIMVNADPYAACLVGRRLGLESGLPVIHDLRDPWALCELRRPKRPAPQRRLVDWMERRCVEDCARFLLNTRTAAEQYRAHYSDLPGDRFGYLRNHSDPELISQGDHRPGDRFTMLFLGNLRRFMDGGVLLEVLGELRRRGHTGRDMGLMVTGRLTEDARIMAADLGVEDMLEDHPFVPYREVGTFMAAADLLVSVNHTSRQRIPAKTYDYATSSRPLLVVCDNPELEELLAPIGGVSIHRAGAVGEIADTVEEELRRGRQRFVDRSGTGLDSATASRKLAGILDEVTSSARPSC